MDTTNTFFNYAIGFGTYIGIAAAIAGRNSSLARHAITELYANAAFRGARFGTRRTVHSSEEVSTQVQNTDNSLNTVA